MSRTHIKDVTSLPIQVELTVSKIDYLFQFAFQELYVFGTRECDIQAGGQCVYKLDPVLLGCFNQGGQVLYNITPVYLIKLILIHTYHTINLLNLPNFINTVAIHTHSINLDTLFGYLVLIFVPKKLCNENMSCDWYG